ncbi:MAG: metallophosphoesterase [Dehalococcoidia bacterium]|nr:metallophosphoesterase [Dehalococcoidia bacterium]
MKIGILILWRCGFVILLLILMFDVSGGIARAMFVESWPQNPAAPSDCHADFVVFGDSQGSFDPLWTISPDFDKLPGLINQIDVPMAFHVGDMYTGDTFFARGVRNQAESFLGDVATLRIPMHPVMGNHDARGGGWNVTKELIFQNTSTYYSFDQGDSHFVILDAFMPGYEHTLSQEQFRWLEADLASTRQLHIFVFVHAPLYPLGSHLGGSLDKYPAMRDQLGALLVKSGVDILFCGHEHFYASFGYDGLMQVTTGGVGAKLKSPASPKELAGEYGYDMTKVSRLKTQKVLHYVCVSTSTLDITVTAYDLEGNMIDQFSIAP